MIDIEVQNKLRKQFNPDGSDLRKLQLRMFEMLKFIDCVCRRNGIRYWLSSGTCLGAVRHGGFIPWDDDVDIEMLPEDYGRFCKIIEEIKSEKYALQNHETDFEYVAPYAKLRDLNSTIKENNVHDLWYRYKGLYIDIFPVYRFSSELLYRVAGILQIIMLHRLTLISNRFIRRVLMKLNYRVLYGGIFPLFNMVDKLKKDNIIRIGGLGSGFKEKYAINIVEETIEMNFEGVNFPVPKLYDRYLSSLYGNYMELPSLQDIHPHMNNIKFHR